MIPPRPSPFEYPSEPHQRRHRPPEFKDYRDYKPYLRDEFVFRCVYCLTRELWRWNDQSMGVEHWWVKSLHPEESTNYSNLLYVCNDCNNLRGTKPLKESWHPEKHPWAEHLRIIEDGTVVGRTRRGRALRKALQLNHRKLLQPRWRYLAIHKDICDLLQSPVKKYQDIGCSLYKHHFGFPPEMPDLSEAEGASAPYCSRVPQPEWY